jgi:hypothetical protein
MAPPSATPSCSGLTTELLPPDVLHVSAALHPFTSGVGLICIIFSTDVVPQDSWFEELFSRVYKGAQPADTPLTSFSESSVRIDELALLFAYFAMGALVDLDLTPFNYEAEAYACLSRSALTSMNVLKNATIITIEALVSLPTL